MEIIRYWKTMERLNVKDQTGNRIVLTNRHGNIMFDGTINLFHACVDRGWFEVV